jgi:hypothetical protein
MEMHWILTLDVPGRTTLTRYGVLVNDRGLTRAELFSEIRDEVARSYPGMANANTVFWSLEPNQL